VAITITLTVTNNYKSNTVNTPPNQSQGARYTQTSEHTPRLRALYYDPLYREYPNDTLVYKVESMLDSHGYNVTMALGAQAGLEELVVMDRYDVVIIRAHGAVNNRSVGFYPRGEYIYTGLYYNESLEKYGEPVREWLSEGYLAVGVIPPAGRDNLTREELEGLPKYLVVGPKFFSSYVKAKRGSVVIVFGCDTLSKGVLASILLDKGVSLYVGWNGSVSRSFMDRILPRVLEALLSGGAEEVRSYVDQGVIDPYSGARLDYIGDR